MALPNDGLRLPPPWISPAAGKPDREVQQVIIVQRRKVAAGGYSAPAQDYINRVIAADVAAGNSSGLETATQDAYAAFIDGMIADGLLGVSAGVIGQGSSILKASCILAGARTVAGCLVPLVGTAPTNNGFVSGDYNRKTGLLGNGTSKALNSNRADNADPQNSHHLAVYITSLTTLRAPDFYIGVGAGLSSSSLGRFTGSTDHYGRSRSAGVDSLTAATGFFGVNRNSSASYVTRNGGSEVSTVEASATPVSAAVTVFARRYDGTISLYSNGRLSFYSIGESLNMALLDARLVTLMSALSAAIP